jgi:hypothetical protein
MKIVRRAAELAIDRNMDNLDMSVLAYAYKERISHIDLKRQNPFVGDLSRVKPKPFKESILGVMATNRRLRAKKREPSIIELFSSK